MENGDSSIMRNFIGCIVHLIYPGSLNLEVLDGQVM